LQASVSKPSRPSASTPKPPARTAAVAGRLLKSELKNELKHELDSDVDDTDYEDSDWNRRLLQVGNGGF
jgi:hypothetical protein